jgi:hypothetical protein
MDQAGARKRQRALRHAAPERVRELLSAYRSRAARDVPPALYSTRPGNGQRSPGSPAAGPSSPSRTGSSAG